MPDSCDVVIAGALETLDRRDTDPAIVTATLADIARSNRLFGGWAAARWGVEQLLATARPSGPVTLLDVGAGSGDVARSITQALAPRWRLKPIALDHLEPAARLCLAAGLPAVVADRTALPVAPGTVDVVVASQILHHVPRGAVPGFAAALHACARVGVVIADIRRSHVAAAGIWTMSHLFRFHEVTRRDAVLSVGRGFTRRELAVLCRAAGVTPHVRRRPGFRLVAWWGR